MINCEKVALLLILFLANAAAENQKQENCSQYRYHIKTNVSCEDTVFPCEWRFFDDSELYSPITWNELISSLPKLNSISCEVLEFGFFVTDFGKLIGVNIDRTIDLNELSDGGHDILKNILALSNDFQQIHVITLLDELIAPVILEESMFLANKQLERINIQISIQEIEVNTFLHLENLKALTLDDCRLNDFNPNELPSSLQFLSLRNNFLQTFEITKPLVSLIELRLGTNFLTKFKLDLKDILPKIKIVDLVINNITDFQPIGNHVNSTLEQLHLDENPIRNKNAYEWILHNKNFTFITCHDTFPICDCSYEETLKELAAHHILTNCILPVPKEFIVAIKSFKCPGTGDRRDDTCTYFDVGFASKTIVFNCSNTVWPTDISFFKTKGFTNLQFDLSGNLDVRSLPAFPDNFDEKIETHIYAENCNLSSPLSVKSFPTRNLRLLYLANNSIDEIGVEILEKLLEMETHLTLASNPLICNCEHKSMYDKFMEMSNLIDDFNQTTCNDGLPFADRDLCFAWDMFFLYFGLGLFAVLTCFLIIFLRYTLEIQVYIYSRGWFPAYFRAEADEANYKYDVFVSYSDKDEDFVVSVIDYLEEKVSPPFKVCHHHRDWVVGERIDRQIIVSVEESRKTIVILSRNFLTSFWANMEFRTALYTMLEEKAPKLVLIIHGDIGPKEQLKPEIRSYLKTTTYLASDDKWFWQKLSYSLRRPSKKENSDCEPVEPRVEQVVPLTNLNISNLQTKRI